MTIQTRPTLIHTLICISFAVTTAPLIGRDAPGMSRIKRAMEMSGQAAQATIKQLPSEKEKKQSTAATNKRRISHKTGSVSKRLFSELDYDALKASRDLLSAKHQRSTYIKYTEQLIKLCNNMQDRSELILELADALFDDGALEKSADQYATFSLFYPGHPRAEYALYRAVLSSFYRILSADRDQTKTKDTVEHADKFLKQTEFTAYRDEVKKVRAQCFERLIESELYVCDFYLKRQQINAIEQRLTAVRDNLLPEAPSMDAQVLAFQAQVNEEQDRIKNPAPKSSGFTLQLARSSKSKKKVKLARARTKSEPTRKKDSRASTHLARRF